MKLKILKGFNIDKWLLKLEPYARVVVWPFVMMLAILTVVLALPNLTGPSRLWLLIYLILFLFAITIIFTIEIQHALRKRAKPSDADVRESTYIEQTSYNRWITIGLVALVAIILVPIFVARQLQLDAQGYQTFYIAFAATGAWVTGIALALFTYQQYKLRQTEHRLLFEPQILLKSAGTPKLGKLTYNNKIYPYGIEWTVLILNTSQQPIHIESMLLRIRQWGWGKATDKEGYLSPPSYHVLEPDGLEPPFQVTLTTPQRIRWIIEGYNAGQDLDDFFGDSNNRNFELIFYVQATNPQDPSTSIFYRIISNSFRIPKDAKWGGWTASLE